MPRRKAVPTLGSLCLQSLVQHMQSVWVKDYSENYLDEYSFRFVMGPFNDLAGSLVQDLIRLLGESRRLSRAALHLLLLPHLQELSLQHCHGLVSNAIGQLITVRCKHRLGTRPSAAPGAWAGRCRVPSCRGARGAPAMLQALLMQLRLRAQSLSALDLHGCSRLSTDVLVDLVEELPLLSRLGLAETQANVQVLAAVGSSCRRLRELDVSRCKKVTPRALRHLAYDPLERTPGCPTLRVLLARGLEPAGDGAVPALAFVLLALPLLEVLAHSDAPAALALLHAGRLDDTGDADGFPSLRELARRRGGPPFALPLRHLEELTEPELAAARAVCPDAEEVTACLGDGETDAWDALLSWSRLARLGLSCAGPRGRALCEALPLVRGLGSRLQSLALHGFLLEDELALCALLGCCPNLRDFSAELRPPPRGRPDAEPPEEPPRWDTELLPRDLPRLRRFSLALPGPVPEPHGLLLRATLASLLCRCPRLQSLRLLGIALPLDSVFETVLTAPGPPLQELQELSLVESRVSGRTVRLLLASDGRLRRLDVSRCRDVHRRDYDGFLQAVRKQRLDLDITWE